MSGDSTLEIRLGALAVLVEDMITINFGLFVLFSVVQRDGAVRVKDRLFRVQRDSTRIRLDRFGP